MAGLVGACIGGGEATYVEEALGATRGGFCLGGENPSNDLMAEETARIVAICDSPHGFD